jgi:hypothetical protein
VPSQKIKKGASISGYNKGVCYFNPAFVLEERIVPQVVITDMKIYESGVAPKK